MRKFLLNCCILALSLVTTIQVAQAWDLSKLVSGAGKLLQAATITDSQMRSYVGQAVAQMDAQNQVAPASSPYTARLNALTRGLTSVDGIPLNFKVYITKEINAFACADGSVRVYSGIMDLMSDDELLGIIGHEVGHVAKKHSKKATQAALTNSAILDGIGSYGGVVGQLSSGVLGKLAETLANNKYSRKQENEADDYGYDFLKTHGKNPWAMAMSFEKLQMMEKSSGAGRDFVTKMFSDHPDTANRIKRMSERARRDGYTRPTK